MPNEHPVVQAFRRAAEGVPSYGRILREAGVRPQSVESLEDFLRLVPVIDKPSTFGRFPVEELCMDGRLPALAGVLTSSGHSGQFAFGLYDFPGAEGETRRVDDALDALFAVRARSTLLVNCLPMGVKVPTRLCTLAETSVRADMAAALVAQFGRHFQQVVLVGETAFIKHLLEMGRKGGIDWKRSVVHVVVGEEPLAENARTYLAGILGIDPDRGENGHILSSMGVAELGLNLFSENPSLVAMRRRLHQDGVLRETLLGPEATTVPSVFTYDPSRIFVEIGPQGELILSTLDLQRPLPLIRYATSDRGAFPSPRAMDAIRQQCPAPTAGADTPILLVFGRGQRAMAGASPVYPEQVKEGLYHDAALAGQTTGNFRIRSGKEAATLRIQLSPGVAADARIEAQFSAAMTFYVRAPIRVRCENYESFTGGMALDYERKFDYLESADP